MQARLDDSIREIDHGMTMQGAPAASKTTHKSEASRNFAAVAKVREAASKLERQGSIAVDHAESQALKDSAHLSSVQRELSRAKILQSTTQMRLAERQAAQASSSNHNSQLKEGLHSTSMMHDAGDSMLEKETRLQTEAEHIERL